MRYAVRTTSEIPADTGNRRRIASRLWVWCNAIRRLRPDAPGPFLAALEANDIPQRAPQTSYCRHSRSVLMLWIRATLYIIQRPGVHSPDEEI